VKNSDTLDFEITFYESIVRERPNYLHALVPLAEAYTAKKLYRKGLEIDKRLAKLDPTDPVIHYNLACSFALLRDEKSALEALKKAIQFGYDDFDHMKRDKDLKVLHNSTAFRKLLGIERKSYVRKKEEKHE
jgi:tetratricopeptide (TPR) repeat protein